MSIRVNGTVGTRKMIKNISNQLHKQRPNRADIDYSITLSNKHHTSSLTTGEGLYSENYTQAFRNISLLYVNSSKLSNGIHAAIGNKTGNILIHDKPFFMSTKKAVKKIQEFLAQLQPENLGKPQKVSTATSNYSDYIKTKSSQEFKNFKIEKIIEGSNSSHSGEILESYIKL